MLGGASVHAAGHGKASGVLFPTPCAAECNGGQWRVLSVSVVERDADGRRSATSGTCDGRLCLFGGVHGVLRGLHEGGA